MLPPEYRWEAMKDGEALYLDGLKPYPFQCACWTPAPGGGILMHWGVLEGIPHQRVMATTDGAKRFAEAWVLKWDADIRRVVQNKGAGEDWKPPSAEVARLAASRDRARRRGRKGTA